MRIAEHWRRQSQERSLTCTVVEGGEVAFPPRPVKPRAVATYDFKESDPLAVDSPAASALDFSLLKELAKVS